MCFLALPFKVVLSLEDSRLGGVVSAFQLYPQLVVLGAAHSAQVAQGAGADPTRGQHNPDPVANLQV